MFDKGQKEAWGQQLAAWNLKLVRAGMLQMGSAASHRNPAITVDVGNLA